MRSSELGALPWQEVQATNIARIAWTGDDASRDPVGELFVHFYFGGEASVYRYFEVPESAYRAVLSANSPGRMHAKVIKDKYRYERVSIEPDETEPGAGDDPLLDALEALAARVLALEAKIENLDRLMRSALRRTRKSGTTTTP